MSRMTSFLEEFKLNRSTYLIRRSINVSIVQVCVPEDLRRPFLYSLHGLAIAGHDGVERTRSNILVENLQEGCESLGGFMFLLSKNESQTSHRGRD